MSVHTVPAEVQDIRQHLATIESEGFEDATYGAAFNSYNRGSLEAAAYTRGFERAARRARR